MHSGAVREARRRVGMGRGFAENDNDCDDMVGEIKPGQVLTMQVDMDAGTLKFWLDDKPHGPGYTCGVTGPLHWATTVQNRGRDC